jgi:hypothetical protein
MGGQARVQAAGWCIRAAKAAVALGVAAMPLTACVAQGAGKDRYNSCRPAPTIHGSLHSIDVSSACDNGARWFAMITSHRIRHCYARTIRVQANGRLIDFTDLYLETDDEITVEGIPLPFGVIEPLETELGDIGAPVSSDGEFRSAICTADGRRVRVLQSFRRN